MNRPIATRILEGLNKYDPIVKLLEKKHPEFSQVVHLVKLVVQGLTKYYGLFILDQHEKLIHVARIEDDYSRNVTVIARQLRTWAKHPDLTLRGKVGLDRLYLILKRCLRDALELFAESERELTREGTKIYMSVSDAFGEYERAQAALWKFQHEFHLHQIDFSRGSDRAIIYGQPGCAGPPAGFGNFEFSAPGWQEPDMGNNQTLPEEKQEKLRTLLDVAGVQRLLPRNMRNPNISLSPVQDDDGGKKVGPLKTPPHRFIQRLDGTLKTPTFGPQRDKPKKKVRFELSEHSPLPDDKVYDRPGTITCVEPPPIIRLNMPTDPSLPPLLPPLSGSPRPTWTTTPIAVKTVTTRGPDSSEDSLIIDEVVEETTISDVPTSPTSPASSSSSSSLPSVGSLSPKYPPSNREDGDENAPASNSSEDEDTGAPPTSPPSTERDRISLARTAEEVGREVALSVRAYLGRRRDEYGMALAADPATDPATDSAGVDENHSQGDKEDWRKNEDYAPHNLLRRSARDQTARDVKDTALLHWAGVTKAKREERSKGYARLRAILKWAEEEGKVPLSPSSIRASTGLRRGLFEPLGPPDLPPPRRGRRMLGGGGGGGDAGPYREATLASLAQLRPRLDVSLLAFLSNQDALRLLGGLVGENPQPRDLARMDKLLRELEVYTAVCAHRRGLIVSHLKRTRSFPTSMAAQFGDVAAARADAEEDQLSASRRCFEYVAERSRYVMAYPGGKRRRREFAGGGLGPRDRERLEHLSGVEDEAHGLRAELEAADEWFGWCRDVMDRWALGWRPGRVERDMLYVGEETLADVRRYQWEINQKRVAIGLVTVRRPQDEVYERQQEHMRLFDRLYKVMS